MALKYSMYNSLVEFKKSHLINARRWVYGDKPFEPKDLLVDNETAYVMDRTGDSGKEA